MAGPASTQRSLHQPFFVDDWLVDPGLHTISRGTTTTRLEPKALQLLILLAEHCGQAVSKEELIRGVWPDTFVSDQVLTNTISDLRHAFGTPRGSRLIQTKGGYRLTARVAETVLAEECQPTPAVSDVARPHGALLVGSRHRRMALIALLLLAVLALTYVLARRRLLRTSEPAIKSLAVLPLANISGDATQEYFVDGMTEELITELSRIKSLRVISRTTAMSYKASRKPLPEIARELGVEGVVEGAVMREGNRIRITVQLIYAPSDQHLWSSRYETDLNQILLLQARVAQDIAQRIRITLTAEEKAPTRGQSRPLNPAAYEAYLKGRFYAGKWTPAMFPKALQEFQRAIALDPDYAEAHAGLAYGYFLTAFFCERPECKNAPEYVKRSKLAAAKAVELDDALAAAHAMLGTARWYDEWDRSAAEVELRRALDLDPNSIEVLLHYVNYLSLNGRHAEAVRAMEQALARDPLSEEAHLVFNYVLRSAGQYDRGIEQLRKILELEPTSVAAYHRLAVLYDLKRMPAEAIRATFEAERLAGSPPAILAALQRAASQGGYEGIVRLRVGQLQRSGGSPYAIASDYARLGDNEKAIRWLEQACHDHSTALLSMAVSPYFSTLRADRRFQDIERRIGFSEEQIERVKNSGRKRGTSWEQNAPQQGGKTSSRAHVNQ